MIEEFKKIKIGDIGEPCMCKRIMKNETNMSIGIPFYKIGTFGQKADAYISKDLFNEYKKKYSYPKKGDVLISASGTIGRTVVFNGESAYFQDSNIVWIDNDETKVLNIYFKYLLSTIDWNVEGSTIKRLYNGLLKSTEIIIPESLSEQMNISKVLINIDNLINSLEKIIEKKEKIKTAIIEEYLKGTKRLKKYDSKWIRTTIKNISNEVTKGNGLSKELLCASGKYKCILYGELFTTYSESIIEVKSYTNINNGVTSKYGDILIPGSTTTVGKDLAKACVIQENGVLLGGDINIIRVKKEINPIYIAYLFTNVLYKEVEKVARGTTIIHLYGKNIENIPIFIPSEKKEQDDIVNMLQNIDNDLNILRKKLKKYELIKEGMMEDLLTGKVRLNYE